MTSTHFQDEKQYLSPHWPIIGNQAEIAGIIRAHLRDCSYLLQSIRRGDALLSYPKYGADSLQSLDAQVQHDGYTLTCNCSCLRKIPKMGSSSPSENTQADN
jgi:hypothetical protein